MQLLLYMTHARTTFNNKYSQATKCREIYITGTRRKKRGVISTGPQSTVV